MSATSDPTLARLEDQIAWYDRKSGDNQRWYKRLKITVILAAASAPVSAAVGAPAWIPGALGALVAVLEGVQHLNQFQQLWISYRSTAEALKHEKYLFLGHAFPYDGPGDLRPLLAERIESLISQEHAKWVSAHEDDRSGGHNQPRDASASPSTGRH